MFMGPLTAVKPWSTQNIEGVSRFLGKVWRLVMAEQGLNPRISDAPVSGELARQLHGTIKTVTEDLEGLRFNTAISALMVLTSALEQADPLPRQAVETLVLLVSPLAPHLGEELWQRLGHRESLAYERWPSYDPQVLVQDVIQWVVQVNGRVRGRVTVPATMSDEALRAVVLADEQVKRYLDGQPIKQFIIVPKRLVNIVLGS
jgi:leucyl-tRNA synthetase